MTNYALLVLMTILGAIAAVFLKKGSVFQNLKGFFINSNLYIGALLYFITALINIYVLKFLDYSVVLPFTSLTYVWTLILSSVIFGEIITIWKLGGLFAILLGVLILSF